MFEYQGTEIFADYLGFTNQTAMLLRGLGCSDTFISECKKRNISSRDLHRIVKRDLVQLGLNDNDAKYIIDELSVTLHNINNVEPTVKDRLKSFIKIQENSKQQLNFINAYIAYYRLRLEKVKTNFYINPNKLFTVSSLLRMTIRISIDEVNDTEKIIQELLPLVPKTNKIKSKHYAFFYAFFVGLSIAVCLIHVQKNRL